MAKWSAQHYNALAYEIRELFPIDDNIPKIDHATYTMSRKANMEKRAILTTLALNLAVRFTDDNPRFDPLRFLNACSPNTDLFPLSELWETYE